MSYLLVLSEQHGYLIVERHDKGETLDGHVVAIATTRTMGREVVDRLNGETPLGPPPNPGRKLSQ